MRQVLKILLVIHTTASHFCLCFQNCSLLYLLGLVFCEALSLHLLFFSLCLFTSYFILPSYLPLIKFPYIQEKQFSLFLSFVFVCIWCEQLWCMYMHVCAHVHLLVFVRACWIYGGDNIGLFLAFSLVRVWGLCCCLLLHILCLLVHKLITVFCSHLPFHHRATAINRSILLMPGFIWILRILPQILLRQVLFSVSLLYTSTYSLTFAEFHIFCAFFPFSCRTSCWFLSC